MEIRGQMASPGGESFSLPISAEDPSGSVLPAIQGTQIQFLGQEDPLEKAKASIFGAQLSL